MFQLEHTELSEKVYRILKQKILNREFAGGQRLDLNELSAMMNISRTPLKDAVNRLTAEGLMEVKPRSGTFISKVTIQDIEEVTEVRLMIELWCVSRLTAEKAVLLGPKLRAIWTESREVLDAEPFDYQRFLELDVRFHTCLVEADGNPRMLAQYHSLNSLLHASRIYSNQSSERSRKGLEEHGRIVRAIEELEWDTAAAGIREHLERSMANMVDHVKRNGGEI